MADTKPTVKLVRPSDLAEEIGVDPKLIRAYLRREFSRKPEAKNTSWHLTPDMVEAVVDYFTPSEDDEEVEDEA